MASLLPCAWSYVEIAARPPRHAPTLDHPVYGGWIAYFSLPSNVEMVVVDAPRLRCARRDEAGTQPRRDEIGRIFATSSRLERSFWDMAYTLERWPDLP